jgi:hypothetical protein
MKSPKNVVKTPATVIDVLDRVLDRGIVIDAWLRVSVAGLALVDVDARVVVASISTYVSASGAIASHEMVARPSALETRQNAVRSGRPAA